jgi:hypothetical protein
MENYTNLKNTLVNLPEEVKRKCMIPIVDNLAFMPGEIYKYIL